MTNLNLAGLVLALFFILLLLTKKNKKLPDYLLTFFIFLLGTFLLIKYAFQNDLIISHPFIVYLDIYYWVLLGPTLFIYTKVSSKGENRIRPYYLFTLIPAVLVTLCFSPYIFQNPTHLLYNLAKLPNIVNVGIYIWMYNSPIFYILSLIELYKHQKKIKHHFSYFKSVDLKWLIYLSHGFGFFILFLILRGPIQKLFGWGLPFDNYGISLFITTVYIFGIGFFGYKQKGIFDNFDTNDIANKNETLISTINILENKNNKPYQKSGLNTEEAHSIINKLNDIMSTEHLYLESELDLPALAAKINVSNQKLSQVINEYLNKNFFDFVNEYRIEKVKEFLSDPGYNQLKIISLAYDSGFGSKSTFYNLFKKIEGITPAEYREKKQQIA